MKSPVEKCICNHNLNIIFQVRISKPLEHDPNKPKKGQ